MNCRESVHSAKNINLLTCSYSRNFHFSMAQGQQDGKRVIDARVCVYNEFNRFHWDAVTEGALNEQ
jgi:hypothetical protein